MCKYYAGRGRPNGRRENLSRMYEGSIQAANRHILPYDHLIPGIQEQRQKMFFSVIFYVCNQSHDIPRTVDAGRQPNPFIQPPSSQFERGNHRSGLRTPDTLQTGQGLDIHRQKIGGSMLSKNAARHIEHTATFVACAEENREQLVIPQRFRPKTLELFPWKIDVRDA